MDEDQENVHEDQRKESLQRQLNNDKYRNWVKAGLGLKYLKEGIVRYVDSELNAFHYKIVARSQLCTWCTTANVVPCKPGNGVCRKAKCTFHDRSDPAKCPTPCPKNTCNELLNDISKAHRYGPPSWLNSDATKWANNAWEVAKCFLPPAYSACRSINDIDCSGLLSLCMNTTAIKLDVIIQLGKDVFSKVKDERNRIMHSSTFEMTDVEIQHFLQLLVNLLMTYRKPVDEHAQSAIDMLNKLSAADFTISSKDEDIVYKDNGIRLNYIKGTTTSKNVYVVNRAEWGARSPNLKGIEMLGTPVSIVLVHHTDFREPWTPGACADELKIIQKTHMDSRGWADIAYSFLIGQDGRVYEGRGWDQVGAHTLGWNKVSLGFAFMGDFSTYLPNDAAIDALKAIIEVGIQKGKIVPDYKLYGHRDMRPTTSPGEPMYQLLKTWKHYGPCPPVKPADLSYKVQ